MSAEEEQPDGIPAWIVSFSDMVTLLLSFFVLLQAFAHERNPDLFYEGQGSFRRAIKGMGIPKWLYGKRKVIPRDFIVNNYAVEPDPNNRTARQIVNAEQEKLAQLFQQIKEKQESQSENMMRAIRVEATPIRFTSGSAELDAQARTYLDALAVDLASNRHVGDSAVYLIGMAPDESAGRNRWILSTLRSRAATQYLRKHLGQAESAWPLRSWGASGRFGDIPESTQVALVILGAEHGRR
jgi:flagellar motor protein MotB